LTGRHLILRFFALLLAAGTAAGVAIVLVDIVEKRSASELGTALAEEGLDFVTLSTDGLLVSMSGTAPDEASRFKAQTLAESLISPDSIINEIEVADATGLDPLRFSVEILRNGDGISLIGLIPAETGRAQIIDQLRDLEDGLDVTDMLETADYPVPDGWDEAIGFALTALRDLPRSKISVSPETASVTALAPSGAEKLRIEASLQRAAPASLDLNLQISAPRPVLTPFALRFSMTEAGVDFNACSADTEAARASIIAAASTVGFQGGAECVIGLGVPSPRWAEAVTLGIGAVNELGGGTLTFKDADVSLVAPDTTPQSTYDRIIGELEASLPPVFSLHAVLPEPVNLDGTGGSDETPEFIGTLSPEGLLQLRGRVSDENERLAVNAYAQAVFGTDDVYSATVLDKTLPDGWPVRVLAGLEALGLLNNGSLVVQPDFLHLQGATGDAEANSRISSILSTKLGDGEDFQISVRYLEELDPLAGLPTPEECIDQVGLILQSQKITFDPSSTSINQPSGEVIDKIAVVLKKCEQVPIEISGYTDSQGREEMNLQLSQARADSVLSALLDRRIITENLVAKGYGEASPIADNGTEEGREANRRIEFSLFVEPEANGPTAAPENPDSSETPAAETEEAAPDHAPTDPHAADTGTSENE